MNYIFFNVKIEFVGITNYLNFNIMIWTLEFEKQHQTKIFQIALKDVSLAMMKLKLTVEKSQGREISCGF